ncbi:unnamed protein product [Dicrocoelium dendriticum]|nr:unnamed protein product [Dicrocoelium dendriticum]
MGTLLYTISVIRRFSVQFASSAIVWLTVNVRNDPCLFSKVNDDWLPYAVREYQRIQQTISEQHLTGKELDNFEVGIRRGVLDILKALREQSFYFYDDITFFENQPVTRNASHADYLLVSEEVYSNVILNQPSLRYLRLNFPYRQFPLEEEVDLLISVVREMCLEVLPGNLPGKASEAPEVVTQLMGFLITGRKLHDGTVQLGMAMAHLILRQLHVAASSLHQNADLCNMFEHKPTRKLRQAQSSSEPKENGANVAGKPVYKKRSECQLLNPLHQRIKAGKFQFIRQVGRYLPFMVQIKEEVDIAIDDCAEVINIREEILETTLELEAILFSTDSDKKILKTKLRANLMDQMERYYMLVCFNAYLRDQTAKRFSLSFTEWMRKHPKLYQVLVYLDVTEWFTTVDLIKQGNRILLSQNAIMSDELCTRRTTGLSNFRQLVGWPIYGASQPDIATVKRIHRMVAAAYWDVALKGMRVDDSIPRPDVTDSKRVPISMPCMIWVCLRNEYVIGCGDNMYAWRVKEAPMEPVVLKGISGPELEEYEDRFVESIQKLNITCTPLRLDFETDTFVPESAITLTQAISTKEMFKRAFSSDTDPANLTTSEGQSSGIPESYAKYVEQHAEYHRVCVSASGLPSPASRDEKDPVKKEEQKRKSLAFLEEYFYLILFNMYLHDCQATRWKHSFEVWMEEVTKKCNYMELLDNFGFPEFEQIDALGRLRTRWRPHVTADSNFNGVY